MSVLVRCDGCGGLRWSLLPKPGAPTKATCEICGEPFKLERRRPGRRFGMRTPERRDLQVPADGATPDLQVPVDGVAPRA